MWNKNFTVQEAEREREGEIERAREKKLRVESFNSNRIRSTIIYTFVYAQPIGWNIEAIIHLYSQTIQYIIILTIFSFV